jgi:FMN phosphatase YigB (HAD superfamily)
MGDTISGVLFDVGGVLFALDGMPSLAALLGIEAQHDALHALWMASPSVVAHETGRIGVAEFAAGVVADLGLTVTADVFLQDFCSWPKGLLPGVLELLDEIPPTYHVAALSNLSAVHWGSVVATGLARRFEQMYLSHQIGHVKPAPEAFLAALNGMGLSPSEVLFLDDGPGNVDAANTLGMEAHVVRSPGEARMVLARFGVVPSTSAGSTGVCGRGRPVRS